MNQLNQNKMNDNELIAEFMGAKPLVLGGSTEYEMYGVLDCIEDGVDEKHYYIDDEMRFHESWDWLMPVVQKIESLGYVFTIQGGKAEYGEMISETRCFIAEDKLSSTYKAVVEFIKQYNDGQG